MFRQAGERRRPAGEIVRGPLPRNIPKASPENGCWLLIVGCSQVEARFPRSAFNGIFAYIGDCAASANELPLIDFDQLFVGVLQTAFSSSAELIHEYDASEENESTGGIPPA